MKNLKIKYTEITKSTYETSSTGIAFNIEINGVIGKGYWVPSRGRYVSRGVDVNEITVNNQYVKIFDGGGTYKTYEIAADLEFKSKQPKDLRFTGRTMLVSNLKNIFINKIKKALTSDANAKLSDSFLNAFKISC